MGYAISELKRKLSILISAREIIKTNSFLYKNSDIALNCIDRQIYCYEKLIEFFNDYA